MIMYNYDDIQTQPSAALLSLLNREPDHDNSINRIFRCEKIPPKKGGLPHSEVTAFFSRICKASIFYGLNVTFFYLHRH